MNNWSRTIVEHVWNVAMHVLHIFLVCHKHNPTLGGYKPSSPFTNELHGPGYFLLLFVEDCSDKLPLGKGNNGTCR